MADHTPTKEPKITIKVIVDKVKKKVVYIEADYSFVDILFSFMTLPMATIIKLMRKHDADKKFDVLGSLNNLYQSLNNFPECYLATEECKLSLLNPRSVSYHHCRNLRLQIDDSEPMKYFRCSNPYCSSVCSISDKVKCRNCGALMNKDLVVSFLLGGSVGGGVLMNKVASFNPGGSDGGTGVFVSDTETFIVTDDLLVMPYTSAGIFRLLTGFGITDTCNLEERKIEIGREQILILMKIALSVDSAFTHFLFPSNPANLNPLRSGQATTFDQCNINKKEASKASKILLELYVQKSTRKLLFAEVKDDFVDFLFGFLSIPLATLIGTLMEGVSSITCMDNLYKSILDMSVGRYLKSQEIKDMLVKPHFGQEYASKHLIFPLEGSKYSSNLLQDPRINEAFLKQSGLFIVTDDLVVTPSSSDLAMTILNKLQIPFGDVETIENSIGLEEALRMLKASLLSTSTLTNSFEHLLKKK